MEEIDVAEAKEEQDKKWKIIPLQPVFQLKQGKSNFKCIMATSKIFSETPEKFYSCKNPGCAKLSDRICKACLNHCHKNHTRGEERKLILLKNSECLCDKYDHVVAEGKTPQKATTKELKCPFEQYSYALKFKCYVIETKRGVSDYKSEICYGCYNKCWGVRTDDESRNYRHEIKTNTVIPNNCQCQICQFKDSSSEFIWILSEIIKKCKTEENINYKSAFNIILQSQTLRNLLILPIKSLYASFSEFNFSKQVLSENFLKVENIWKLFRHFISIYQNEIFDFFFQSNIVLDDSIFKTTVVQFFKSFNLKEKLESYEIQGYRYYALNFLRKMLIIPITKQKLLYDISKDNRNITPFHREIITLTETEFFKLLEPYGFTKQLYFQVISSFGMGWELFNEKYSYLFIIEYIKWWIMLFSLRRDQWDIENRMGKRLEMNFSKIRKVFREKEFDNATDKKELVSKYLEKFFVTVFNTYSDMIFMNTVIYRTKEFSTKDLFFYNTPENQPFLELFKMWFVFNECNININIYNLMLWRNDIYVDSLDNLISGRQKLSQNFFDLFSKKINENNSTLAATEKILTTSKEIRERYYNSVYSPVDFHGEVWKIWFRSQKAAQGVSDIDLNLFNSDIKGLPMPGEITKKNYYQIQMLGHGFINNLLSFYNIFNRDLYLQNRLDMDVVHEWLMKIHEILYYFFDNSFIFPIFLNKKTLKIISNYDAEHNYYNLQKDHIQFYKNLFHCIQQMGCKYNLVDFVVLLTNDSLDLSNDGDDIEEEDTHVIFERLKLFKKVLQISSTNSLMEVNQWICDFLQKSEFTKWINIDAFRTSKVKRIKLILILNIINEWHDYYFILLKEIFPISNIAEIMQQSLEDLVKDGENNHEDINLHNKEFCILSFTYTKYYIIWPFDKERFKDMVNVQKRDNVRVKKISSTLSLGNNKSENYNFNEVLIPIFNSLKKNKIIQKKLGISNYSKGLFQNFEKVVLLPSVFLLYRLWYLSPTVSTLFKYYAYETVFLFFKSYQSFLQNIINKLLVISTSKNKSTISNNEDYLNITSWISKFFIIEDINVDIKIYLQNIRDCLEIDWEHINREPWNIKLLLKKFTKYTLGIKQASFLHRNNNKESEVIFFNFSQQDKSGDKEDIQGNSENNNNQQQHYESNASDMNKQSSGKKDSLNQCTVLLDKINNFITSYSDAKEDEENNLLLCYFRENLPDQVQSYETIFTDIMNKCTTVTQTWFFKEKYFSVFEALNKIWITNPTSVQNYFLNAKNAQNRISYKIIRRICNELSFIFQLVFFDFHKLSYKKHNSSMALSSATILIEWLEFLRWLCENHNQEYQLRISLFPFMVDLSGFSLSNFIIEITPLVFEHYQKFKNKEQLIKYFKVNSFDYFQPILTKVTDFMVEITQGSRAGEKLCTMFEYHYNGVWGSFEDYKIYTNIIHIKEIWRYVVNSIEELGIPEVYRQNMIEQFNTNKLIELLLYCTMYLYDKAVERFNSPLKEGNNQSPAKEGEQSSDKKRNNIYNIILDTYLLHYQDFFEAEEISPYFSIACSIFKFFQIAKSKFPEMDISNILNQEDKNNNNQNTYDEINLMKKQTYLFFNTIIKEIQVSHTVGIYDYRRKREDCSDGSSENDDNSCEYSLSENNSQSSMKIGFNLKIIKPENFERYTISTFSRLDPSVLLWEDKDFIEFNAWAPYEDENKKLPFFLNYLKQLLKIIEMRKNIKATQNTTLRKLSAMNYNVVMVISAIISLLTNLILVLSCIYEKGIPPFQDSLILRENNISIVYYLSFAHLLFIWAVFINWFYFRIYYLKFGEGWEVIKIRKLIFDFLSSDLFWLIWNFFWGFLALTFEEFHFAYSLQLFCIFGLSETMLTVLTSVQMRYQQFLSAGLFILIFSLFFTGIKFYWFCDNVSMECQRFWYCFLSLITGGIRAGSGLNLEIKPISDPGYFNEFFVEWLFYFSVILILLNVINGIIVDTFQQEREQSNERNDAKANRCYICSTTRNYFEKKGKSFDDHVNITHFPLNYFRYLWTILKSNTQELNALDYYIYQQIQDNQTGFFPQEEKEE